MTNLSNPTFFSPIEGAFFTLDISIKKGSFGKPKNSKKKTKNQRLYYTSAAGKRKMVKGIVHLWRIKYSILYLQLVITPFELIIAPLEFINPPWINKKPNVNIETFTE